jgi:hypothetical protein
MEFKPFDARHYPTLAVSEGYAEWARTYDAVVQDEMDLRLLTRLREVEWTAAGRVLDLARGTGRIGQWLRAGREQARRAGPHPRDAGKGASARRLRPPAGGATCARPAFPTRATIWR